MFTNKCIKCGKEFETKNPKRVICPDCLYPEKISESTAPTDENGVVQDFSRGYSAGTGNPEGYQRKFNKPQNLHFMEILGNTVNNLPLVIKSSSSDSLISLIFWEISSIVTLPFREFEINFLMLSIISSSFLKHSSHISRSEVLKKSVPHFLQLTSPSLAII